MNQISIFILSDQAITREGLRALLRLGPNLNVIGEADTLEHTLACAANSRIDVIVVDLPLPICSLDATRQIRSLGPSSRVVVLSRYADDPGVGKVVAAELRHAGASALLPKNTPGRELVNAIHRVLTGEAVFPPQDNADQLEMAPATDGAPVVLQPSLTLRQTQVLTFVAEGLANKEIADRLSISPKTVEKHRQSVKVKLQTNNAADLARRAISLGLVQANYRAAS